MIMMMIMMIMMMLNDDDDVKVSTTANIWMSTTANGRYDDDNDDADDVRVSTTAKIWMSTTANIWKSELSSLNALVPT